MNIQELLKTQILDKIREPKNLSLTELFVKNLPSHFRFKESFRTLRTNINFSSIDKEVRSILVTSSVEKEGKTTTALNLAYTISQLDKSVLLLDGDLRKPSLGMLVSEKNPPGLSGLLSDTFSTEVNAGVLEEFGVGDLFRLLNFQKKTGVLRLAFADEKVNIYFDNGTLKDVNWLTRPEDKKLVTSLIKNKLITPEQAEIAMSRKQRTDQKLGFILINMGFVKEEDMAGFINLHMIEGLRAAMAFKSGSFSFEKLSETYFQRPSFDPSDLHQMYSQAVIGEENIPYLRNKLDTAIFKTDTQNLHILPSGPCPPDPTELLASERMSFLLTFFKQQFDFVIIDSPPVLPASDALLIAPQTDGVILIIKGGSTDRKMVKKALEQIMTTQANIIGTVLCQVDVKKEGYYKYYSKYYDKYYGENP
ncbi:MAG: DUF4388 domain-containing protein [Deltaproteobacteria bacterium]|nr:DUF4388 domain-containing protein [Deltaproteobacteria bacterium]